MVKKKDKYHLPDMILRPLIQAFNMTEQLRNTKNSKLC